MDYNENKVDEAVLALLYLTLHGEIRAWKSLDWDVMNRLHEKGLIYDPRNKYKSIAFTPEGLQKAEELFKRLFQTSENTENQKRTSISPTLSTLLA